jgi:8-oxo-dGTP pyrophosphatase MutT (NUDIX family)
MEHGHISWARKARKVLVKKPYLNVYEDVVELHNGETIDDYTIVSLPNGVVVVATDHDGKLITQYEYKYAINRTVLTLPAGCVEEGDSILGTAARELLEETGYKSDELELVQTVHEYPSKADHTLYIVRAKNAKKVSAAQHDATENISPVLLLSPGDKEVPDLFCVTSTISALALTLPDYLER